MSGTSRKILPPTGEPWRKIVIENALDAVIGMDEEHTIIDWNRQAKVIFGWSSAEAIGKKLPELIIPPELRESYYRGVRDFLSTGEGPILNHRVEMTAIHRNRGTFAVELSVLPIRWKGHSYFYSFVRDISERELARKALENSERELRASRDQLEVIFENIADGVLVQDSSFRCIRANRAGALLCGYSSAAEFVGAPVKDALDRFEMLTESGEPFPLEQLPARQALKGVRHPPEVLIQARNRETGRTRVSSVTSRPVFDPSGKPYLAVSIFRDITHQKEIESSLRSNERQLQFALEAGEIGIWEVDTTTGIFRWDARTRALFGLSPDEKADFDVLKRSMPPEDWERAGKAIARALDPSTDGAYEAEYRITSRKDGKKLWVLSKGRAFFDPDHRKAIRFIGTIRDITGRKRRQASEELLQQASAALFSSLNYEQTLQALAQLAVPRLSDWCSIHVVEEGVPRSVAVALPDPSKRQFVEEYRTRFPPDWNADTGAARVLKTGKSELHPVVTEEMQVAAAKNAEHLRLIRELQMRSVMIVPIQARGKILGVFTLVSSQRGRHYTEEDLKVAEELGRRAGLAVDNAMLFKQAQNAIRARDEFLSIASHELRTPITSLKLQAQMQKQRLEKGDLSVLQREAATRFIETVDRQSERLSKLVDNMLDISRIAHGRLAIERETVDLGELVHETVSRFAYQLEAAGCDYRVELEGTVIGEWDRFRLEQVISNLITNAMKYGRGNPVHFRVSARGDHAILVVADRGIGIATANLDRIFERFERAITSTNISGLGLGLYISRQIVEAHGGSIRVESELGRGSTFTVELPLD